jgi:hypothetical protein
MSTQLITLHGRPRAICTRRRVYLLLDDTASDTPFVLAMCLYAGQILNGHRSGPYRQTRARAYARALLVPAELHEPPARAWDTNALAAWLGAPPAEIQLALATPRTPRRTRRRRRLAHGCLAVKTRRKRDHR